MYCCCESTANAGEALQCCCQACPQRASTPCCCCCCCCVIAMPWPACAQGSAKSGTAQHTVLQQLPAACSAYTQVQSDKYHLLAGANDWHACRPINLLDRRRQKVTAQQTKHYQTCRESSRAAQQTGNQAPMHFDITCWSWPRWHVALI
jgi:hypothetical protein